MTVTLIAVVLLFLVCQTPTAIFLLYRSVVGETTDRRDNNLRLGKWTWKGNAHVLTPNWTDQWQLGDFFRSVINTSIGLSPARVTK